MNRGNSKHSFIVVHDAQTLERKRLETPQGRKYGYFYNGGKSLVLRLLGGRFEDIGEPYPELELY